LGDGLDGAVGDDAYTPGLPPGLIVLPCRLRRTHRRAIRMWDSENLLLVGAPRVKCSVQHGENWWCMYIPVTVDARLNPFNNDVSPPIFLIRGRVNIELVIPI